MDFEIDPNAMHLDKKISSSPGLSVKYSRQSEGKLAYSNLGSSQGSNLGHIRDSSTVTVYRDPRLRYYQQLRKQTKEAIKGREGEDILKESFLNPFGLPVMNLEDSLFFGGIEKLIPFDTEKETGKHGALTNVFSCLLERHGRYRSCHYTLGL